MAYVHHSTNPFTSHIASQCLRRWRCAHEEKIPWQPVLLQARPNGLNVVFLNVFGAVVLCMPSATKIYVLRSVISTRCGVVVRAPSKFILLYHRLAELCAHHHPKTMKQPARIRIRPNTRKTDQPWGGELAEEQNAIRLIARQKYLNWKRAYNVSQCTRCVCYLVYSGRTYCMDSLNRTRRRECAR